MGIVLAMTYTNYLFTLHALLFGGNGLLKKLQYNMKQKQTILQALYFACNGMRYFFLHERNATIQLSIAAIVVIIAVGFGISTSEWIAILFCIAMVLCLEMVNTALEKLCDVVQEDFHPVIKTVKDIAAGAVLMTSLVSIAIASIIFLPKIFSLLC